ncbi:MAG: methyltransferase domain-containing protein [Candidatus Methylomirabilaceae bacterium]
MPAASVRERNLAALALRQPELAEWLRGRSDDPVASNPSTPPGGRAGSATGELEGRAWAFSRGASTLVLVFGADALLRDSPCDAALGPALAVVVERQEARLREVLRSVDLAPSLEKGQLALVLAGNELELVEALKPLVPLVLPSDGPAIVMSSGLSEEEAQEYGRWGDEARRFIELSRDPTILNIELYQRFKPVADRINALAERGLSVLDVGGREWAFSAFLPGHRVVVADLETTGIDARALPHGDDSFDVVTSHHLLEHVPAPDRLRVVAELVRVARRWVFLTGPFEENRFAREIDELLVRLEPNNPYLREHAKLGLPSLGEIESWLKGQRYRYRVEPLTRCNIWLLALALTPFQQVRPREFREVTRYYNQRFSEFDRVHPAYQTLIEIEVR